MRYAILYVSTNVFPEPGTDATLMLPSVCVIASVCSFVACFSRHSSPRRVVSESPPDRSSVTLPVILRVIFQTVRLAVRMTVRMTARLAFLRLPQNGGRFFAFVCPHECWVGFGME